MQETVFEELKRYVRFGPEDQAALRGFAASAEPSFVAIAEDFYLRLREHKDALRVFADLEQIERLKKTLVQWMTLLLQGPWDAAYYEQRARIGRMHVSIALPQRFMFGAMDLIRIGLDDVARQKVEDDTQRCLVQRALHKVLDLELAIMLETYHETFVDKLQRAERKEREELERQLQLSEARYDEIVEKGEALVTTSDARGLLLLFNGKCEAMTGMSRAQARGQRWQDIFVPEADRATVTQQQTDALAGKDVGSYEGAVVCGEKHHRIRWHFTTLPGRAAATLCAIGIDITVEHNLGVRTRRAERLAALGTMAAGLAHEIRNPLNSAHLQLSVAQRRIARAQSPELHDALGPMRLAEDEIKRLAGLVEDFLHFARPQALRLTLLDLRATAQVIIALMTPEAAAAGVELRLEAGEATWLEFDAERIKQVLLNFIRNAIEASSAGGRISVRVRRDGEHASLSVEDQGSGLAEGAPIFEPFFTTKEDGTGLGLAIVHRIAMDHGGSVDAESKPGRTVFTISLPVARRSVPPP